MSSSAVESSVPEVAPAASPARSAYHPDVLREQVRTLRQAAADRSAAETRITATFEAETTAIHDSSARALTETRQKAAADIDAAKRKHQELTKQAEAWRAAERRKIDEYRQAKTRELTKACDEAVTDLEEEEVFEQVRFKEVAAAKTLEPQQAARAWEQKLGAALGQLDTEAAAVTKQLAAWGVKDAGAPATAAAVGQGTPLEQVLAARDAVAQIAKEVLEDAAAKAALSGGISGLFAGKKGEIRDRLAARQQTLLAHVQQAKSLDTAAREWIATKGKDLKRQVETKLREEDAARKAKLAEKLKAAKDRRDAALAALTAKCGEAEAKVAAKVGQELAAADQKDPAHVAALEQTLATEVERLEHDRDARLAAASRKRDTDWAAMTAAWQQARTSTAGVWAEAARLDTAAFKSWSELADESVPLPQEPPPGLRFGDLGLTLERIPGGVSSTPALNEFGPISWKQPATLAWPVTSSLLIKTAPEEKETASAMMQALTLRIATGLPPARAASRSSIRSGSASSSPASCISPTTTSCSSRAASGRSRS